MRRSDSRGPDLEEECPSDGAVGGRTPYERSQAGQVNLGVGCPDWSFASDQATETLLVVDDEGCVRTLAEMALIAVGYKVLTANHGAEALKLLDDANGTVDLILIDVVMPGMSGPELAELAKRRRPNVKALFTSGYTDDSIACQVGRAGEFHFIQKPYTITQLTRKVREVLDSAH